MNHNNVDFLDLDSGLFKPFMKENNTIPQNSNHPPSITKNLPSNVNRRLRTISASEHIFQWAMTPYQKALNESGYHFNLKYVPDGGNGETKRNSGRNKTYINPPFSANISTNIGAEFLRIIDTCFPPGHILHRIINRNTVKISWWMANMLKALGKQKYQKLDLPQSPSGLQLPWWTPQLPTRWSLPNWGNSL